jgi:gamma-glutamyltranspeptidase / glutathione hydrolase
MVPRHGTVVATIPKTVESVARWVPAFAGTTIVVLFLLLGAARAASLPAVEAGNGIVVTAQRRASEVGLRILAEGGNAVDAAVAVGYALAVVDPCCGNIGGGGFMTLRLADGRERVIDFRETAPAAASAGMYLGKDGKKLPRSSLDGWLSAAVPGTVMGLDRALAARQGDDAGDLLGA